MQWIHTKVHGQSCYFMSFYQKMIMNLNRQKCIFSINVRRNLMHRTLAFLYQCVFQFRRIRMRPNTRKYSVRRQILKAPHRYTCQYAEFCKTVKENKPWSRLFKVSSHAKKPEGLPLKKSKLIPLLPTRSKRQSKNQFNPITNPLIWKYSSLICISRSQFSAHESKFNRWSRPELLHNVENEELQVTIKLMRGHSSL